MFTAAEPVFRVPSVTLLDADELPAFAARYLRNRLVVIVPYADAFERDGVLTQALLCRSFLGDHLGFRTVSAAPSSGRPAQDQRLDDLLAEQKR
jgi:hypothetical protein